MTGELSGLRNVWSILLPILYQQQPASNPEGNRSSSRKLFTLFTRTADVLPPPLNCSHVKMKNNLKWMAGRAEVLAKADAYRRPAQRKKKNRWGLVCRARAREANRQIRTYMDCGGNPACGSDAAFIWNRGYQGTPRRCRRCALPAQSKTSNHCRYRYQAPSDRIKVKTMSKMPIFQVEPTETDRNYFHAMETESSVIITPSPIHSVLLASNHKSSKNGRNQSRSKRIGVFGNSPLYRP